MTAEELKAWFNQAAASQGWDTELQRTILLDYVAYHAGSMSMVGFVSELIEATQPPPAPSAQPQQALGGLAELDNFFDRDLSRQILPSLSPCPLVGHAPTDDGTMTEHYEMIVPETELDTAKAMLDGLVANADPAGNVQMGWHADFRDGSTAVFAITKGGDPNAFYIDAFAILPKDADPQAPNPSMPPVTSVAAPFRFVYADGTQRVVRLQPTS